MQTGVLLLPVYSLLQGATCNAAYTAIYVLLRQSFQTTLSCSYQKHSVQWNAPQLHACLH